MASTIQQNGANGVHGKPDYDLIVVGAGFAGLRMIHSARQLGLSVKVIEAGSDVGGVWYWNRYPGARTDSENWVYILNFSKELNTEWDWPERFPTQPQVLAYLRHVADKFDMRKDIKFNARVKSAIWDEENTRWNFHTEQGEVLSSRYFVSGTGPLTVPKELPFAGVKKFKGEWYQTARWPQQPVDFKGKRVAVIGTGATAVQVIPTVAHNAKSLHVFQRTPNFVIPSRNYPITADEAADVKSRYDEVWQHAKTQIFGLPAVDSKLTMDGMSDAQVNQILESGWETGGFRFFFETFADLITNPDSNAVAAEFVRNKIRAVVKDKVTAELLCPQYAVFAKRPPLGHFYYETFNKPNVHLVDTKSDPIQEITETGVRTGTEEYEFDMIIYALGFDAATGALTNIDIQGKDGQTLKDRWSTGLRTFLGLMVANYPNMFMIMGPHAPFINAPLAVDGLAEVIERLLRQMQEKGQTRVEPTKESMEAWSALLQQVFDMTVISRDADKIGSWFTGSNIPGKPNEPVFWLGGAPTYFAMTDKEAAEGYTNLRIS